MFSHSKFGPAKFSRLIRTSKSRADVREGKKMKKILNAMVRAVGDQAIALGAVADQLLALKQTLARQFPDIADELKAQIEAEQEKSRKDVYELQVSLAKLREAIAQMPEADAKLEKKRKTAGRSTMSEPGVGKTS
jgi:gas vesicle protein